MAFIYKVQEGDTANSIAQRYGFSNYREAGISSVPSGDFNKLQVGDEINLENYDPNNITSITPTSQVISSKDNEQSFTENSKTLDEYLQEIANINPEVADKVMDDLGYTKGDTTQDTGATTDTTVTKDEQRTAIDDEEMRQKDDYQAEAAQKKKDYEKLFSTRLASIDATANATVNRIRLTYDKRLEEQARINDLNIARVKAYGLGGSARFTPISYGDAVSNREQEAADKISSLEIERDGLIAQAEAARQAGESQLLADRMDDIASIEKELKDNLKAAEEEADRQYKLLKEFRTEEEKKHKEALEKMQKNFAVIANSIISEENYDTLDDDGKSKVVKKYMNQTGLDFFTIYGILEEKSAEGYLDTLERAQKEENLKGTRMLNEKRAKDLLDNTDEEYTDQEQRKLEQAGLDNADRQTQLDYLYGDELQQEEAKAKAGEEEERVEVTAPDGTKGTIPKSQLEEALASGYTQG